MPQSSFTPVYTLTTSSQPWFNSGRNYGFGEPLQLNALQMVAKNSIETGFSGWKVFPLKRAKLVAATCQKASPLKTVSTLYGSALLLAAQEYEDLKIAHLRPCWIFGQPRLVISLSTRLKKCVEAVSHIITRDGDARQSSAP
ncbi:hypothetical protein KL928_004979 [Ogataea angusta]|uniref:Uncharacterized protein n=1 Tax=Pichia angusta TaxID=870730 RepID=A0AAN6DBI7_PICAN|nr:uncharacterized protein KL928_004979 [Ogataea angusta]KAG7816013.1 hypothetical protein KL928_004979 [Ogataea angusta]